MKISKRERKYVTPAILYGWKMEKWLNTYYWDGGKWWKFESLANSKLWLQQLNGEKPVKVRGPRRAITNQNSGLI